MRLKARENTDWSEPRLRPRRCCAIPWLPVLFAAILAMGCGGKLKVLTSTPSTEAGDGRSNMENIKAYGRLSDCKDPDLTKIVSGVKVTLCDGSLAEGTLSYPRSCQADGETDCRIVGEHFVAVKLDGLEARVVKGESMFGVEGIAEIEDHQPCQQDGEVGCIATNDFPAVDMASVVPHNIRVGVTMAGVLGMYPSAGVPLEGNGTTTDLIGIDADTAAGNYEFWSSDGVRHSLAILDVGPIAPGVADQILNAGLYRPFSVLGDSDLVVENVRTGASLFGVNGIYPSASAPLAGADVTSDLDLATFDAKIKSLESFEWFDSSGIRHTIAGDTDIVPANIESGTTIFGVTGTAMLGSDCTGDGQIGCITTAIYPSIDTTSYSEWDVRAGKSVGGVQGALAYFKNAVDNSFYNRTSGTGGQAGLDIYDTIDDYRNGGAFPSQAPGDYVIATGSNWEMDSVNDNGSGTGGVAGDGVCNGTEACVFKDRLTEVMWARSDSSNRTWEATITYCENLSYGGYSDWRLATQKEALQGYINGIWKIRTALNLGASVGGLYYWTATSAFSDYSAAVFWDFYYSQASAIGKNNTFARPLCVR